MAVEDFKHWLTVQHVVMKVNEWSLAELGLELYDAPEDAELAPSEHELFVKEGARAPILIRNSDGKRFILRIF